MDEQKKVTLRKKAEAPLPKVALKRKTEAPAVTLKRKVDEGNGTE